MLWADLEQGRLVSKAREECGSFTWHGANAAAPFLVPICQQGHGAGGFVFFFFLIKIFPVILSHLRDEAEVALIWAMHAGIIRANYLGQG